MWWGIDKLIKVKRGGFIFGFVSVLEIVQKLKKTTNISHYFNNHLLYVKDHSYIISSLDGRREVF